MAPVITGPMAAGKSAVALLLAARFERGVHLEGDHFRRSIVSGRVDRRRPRRRRRPAIVGAL